MTTTGALVPVCAGCASVALASSHDLLDALQARHDLFPQGSEDHVPSGPTLDLNRICFGHHWRREKVDNGFVVYFKITASQKIFSFRGPFYETEDISHGARDDARFRIVSGKSKRLSRSRLSICEDDSVVTLHGRLDMRACNSCIDRLVRCSGEDSVEIERR